MDEVADVDAEAWGRPRALPGGTVTFLFSDIESSTKLLGELGEDAYARALATHRAACRDAFEAFDGVEVDTQGDSFFVAFADASAAARAAARAQARLANGRIRVRMGIHTGTPLVHDGGYVGLDVHRAARIAAAAHGGQVLISSSTRPVLGPEIVLMSLGRHRLKDFDEPIELFQLGHDPHPPLRSIAPSNLPTPASSFVGRPLELARADEVRRQTRVLTVVGSGGAGKTRLAIELARLSAYDYPGGLWFVSLSALTDPGLVMSAITAAIGLDGHDPADAIVEHLRGLPTLILLDNMEHLSEAASALADLVRNAPTLTLLTTSRVPLFIDGEVVIELEPMVDGDAVALFAERCRGSTNAVSADDPAIIELCRRVDCLPLAIELIAARTRMLTPTQILASLRSVLDLESVRRDLPARQQTLRATIVWSHAQLSAPEQDRFAQLSVFSNGWTTDAAHEVCECSPDDLLALMDHSMIRVRFTPEGDFRYWMLGTIREFATEQLVDETRAALNDRLTLRLCRDAAAFSPQLNTDRQTAAFRWFDAELDDLRTTMLRLIDAEDPRSGELVHDCYEYLWRRGRTDEAIELIERTLALDSLADRARAMLLVDSGVEALSDGDTAVGRLNLGRAAAMFDFLGDEVALTRVLIPYGHAMLLSGDRDGAHATWTQCRVEAVRLGQHRTAALVDWTFGHLAETEHRWDDAVGHYTASLAYHRSVDDLIGVAWLSGAIGAVEVRLGHWKLATDALTVAFSVYVEAGLVVGLDSAMFGLVEFLVERAPQAAPRALGWCDRLLGQGLKLEQMDSERLGTLRARVEADTVHDGEASDAARWALAVLATVLPPG